MQLRLLAGVWASMAVAAFAACAPTDDTSSFPNAPVSAPPADPVFSPGDPLDAAPPAAPLHPDLGATVHASVAPPPIFGGTLTVTHDDAWAIAADPDRDAIHVVDLAKRTLHASIALPAGALPFRVAEDALGRVHVTLRGLGAVATIDPASGMLLSTTAVCPDPRGLAQLANGRLAVACERGDVILLALPDLTTIARERTSALHARDVVPDGNGFFLTTFQGARVLRFDGDAHFVNEVTHPPSKVASTYAWRAAASSGALYVSHQLASREVTFSQTTGYTGCQGGPVSGAFSKLVKGGSVLATQSYSNAVIPVDLALSPDGTTELVALPGSTGMPGVPPFAFGRTNGVPETPGCPTWGEGGLPPSPAPIVKPAPSDHPLLSLAPGEVTAVAFTHAGLALAQSREPAILEWLDPKTRTATDVVLLSSVSRADTGHAIFHRAPVNDLGVACASCHAEGGEDGLVWKDKGVPRRTQTLLGTVALSPPYHWSGDEASFDSLSADVYTKRMHGIPLDSAQTAAFRDWVFGMGAPPADAYADGAAVTRGASVYEARGCASCHGGPAKQSFDVGNGGAFQAPLLTGVGLRPPYLHDGCAATLDALVAGSSCGDFSKHGTLSVLTPAEAADLRTYLASR